MQLTKNEVTTETKNHLKRVKRGNIKEPAAFTVFLRPKGLQSIAPTKTPGNAIAPSKSCHSATRLISPSGTIVEMMVPENTPLGNVT